MSIFLFSRTTVTINLSALSDERFGQHVLQDRTNEYFVARDTSYCCATRVMIYQQCLDPWKTGWHFCTGGVVPCIIYTRFPRAIVAHDGGLSGTLWRLRTPFRNPEMVAICECISLTLAMNTSFHCLSGVLRERLYLLGVHSTILLVRLSHFFFLLGSGGISFPVVVIRGRWKRWLMIQFR